MAKRTTTAAAKAADAAPESSDAPQSTQAVKVSIPCAIEVFFTYCRVAWGYCMDYRERLAEKSRRFTDKFINEQLAVVDEVELLPTLKARISDASTARSKALASNQAVRSQLKLLKEYIKFAFPNKALAAVQLKAAGLDNFSNKNNNWGNTAGMIRDSKQYLKGNAAKLAESENMPPDFPSLFDNAAAQFNADWLDFVAKEKAVTDGTSNQEAGIKSIMDQMDPMLNIGQACFEFEPQERKKFTRTHLLNEVRSKHHAGLIGIVRLATNDKPKPGVRVQVEGDAEKFAITNEKGRYTLLLAAGTYNIVFTSEDTLPLTVIGKVVKPGVKGVLPAVLEPKPLEQPDQPIVASPTIAEAPNTSASLSAAIGEVKVENGQLV